MMNGAHHGRKWAGPLLGALGAAMLTVQGYLWMRTGLISARLIGGGIAALFLGGVTWFYYLDDRRHGLPSMKEEIPSADDYERGFQLMGSDEELPDGEEAADFPR